MPIVIHIDPAEIEGLALNLEVDRRAMLAAQRAAANRAARWARVAVARGMAQKLGVPQSVLTSKRVRVRKAGAGKSRASVWVGLNPINVAGLNPRRTASGLRAAGKDFPGAFVARGKYGARVAYRRRGRARYPLDAVAINVLSAAPKLIGKGAWPELNAKFLEFYRAELARRVR